ncbi:aromatase/cyclase [Actinophytocola gossypii]|uniref:Aromatase/cyclase n=1 Tax=Actinophytocola gossypii TaxID=2812003 RepID=A0ABT2JL03_9PSEU|nr:aromatase/cyclase [Actinophytocola gossypii]MCT2587979.1 aromatase/cyclase [Actinophytocola gossypii]
MAELKIWTARHTTKVAAPPKRVYQLIANVDRWPRLFESVLAVEHIGYDGNSQRVRFWGTFGERRGSWVSARELNPKRLRVRFRQEHAAAPLASMGGIWLIVPKGSGSMVALDHYYRVVDDNPAAARHIEHTIARSSTSMLESLRTTAETDEDDRWLPLPDPALGLEGVRLS